MARTLAGGDRLIKGELGLRLFPHIADNDPITNPPEHTHALCAFLFISHMEKLAMNALSGSVAEKVA